MGATTLNFEILVLLATRKGVQGQIDLMTRIFDVFETVPLFLIKSQSSLEHSLLVTLVLYSTHNSEIEIYELLCRGRMDVVFLALKL